MQRASNATRRAAAGRLARATVGTSYGTLPSTGPCRGTIPAEPPRLGVNASRPHSRNEILPGMGDQSHGRIMKRLEDRDFAARYLKACETDKLTPAQAAQWLADNA